MSNLPELLQAFHFLRPWWLLALIPALLLAVLLWRQRRQARQWHRLVDAELLPFLIDGASGKPGRSHVGLLLLAWVLASLALAGPVWEQRPLPVQKNDDALVLILDLSPSMLTEDVKPSRLVRARLKIADILRERHDGLTALVVYAGDAHVVTPLTDDTATINSLLTALQPDIMPLPGSNTESAVETAMQLLIDSGNARGHMLLVTDGVAESAFDTIRQQLHTTDFSLSVLGVGGETPAPIPGGRGNFVRDSQNNIVTTRLNTAELASLAAQTRGSFSVLTSDGRDLERVLQQQVSSSETEESLRGQFDGWYEQGYWLVFLLLPLVLYCFRRGVVLVILCLPATLLHAPPSHAFGWSDLWQTPDQQAQRALENGEAEAAANTFHDPDWKAAAQYRAGQYEAAAQSYASSDTARAHYNRGNALAKAGKLEESLQAYDQALQQQPEFPEAAANRELAEQLLQQQQNKQQQDQNSQSDQQQEGDQDQQQQGENNNSQENDSDPSDNNQDSGQQQQDSEEDQPSTNETGDEQPEDEPGTEAEQPDSGEQSEEDAAGQPEQEQPAEPETSDEGELQPAGVEEDGLSDEQRQALEQWLRRVPDDPSGLLRNKFRYQYHQQQQERLRNSWQVPGFGEEERW